MHRSPVAVAVVEVFGFVTEKDWTGALRALRIGPFDSVGNYSSDVLMEVDGVVLVARAEEEDFSIPAPECAATAEHFPPGEGT